MNKLFFFVCLLFSSTLWSQTTTDSIAVTISDTTVTDFSSPGHVSRGNSDKLRKAKAALQLEFDIEIGSSAVYNDMFLGLLRGEFLTREVRQKSSDAITNEARIGQAIQADFRYIMRDTLFGKHHYLSMLGIGYRDMVGAQFSKTLYDLTFFGNKPYENQTVDLAPLAFAQQKYQKFGWGIFNTRTGASLMLSIVKGQKYQEVDLDKAEVFTGTDGRLITADLQGSYVLSDTANDNFSAFNGIGFAFDITLKKHLNIGGRTDLSFVATDLGLGFWNQNTLRVSQDSMLSYDGITVDNIFDLDNVILGNDAIYDTLGFGFERGGIKRLLPFRLQVIMSKPLSRTTYLQAEIGYRYLRGYNTRFALRGLHRFTQNTSAGIELAYGGFTPLRAGVFISSFVKRNFSISLAVPNLPGPFSNDSRGAEGILKLGYFFY